METVNIDDWKLLCDHFDGPAFKKQSAANVQNRAMVQNPHTTGAKSQSQRTTRRCNKIALTMMWSRTTQQRKSHQNCGCILTHIRS
ncbi:unnamed protein product, partial [Linum tenue]